MNELMESIAALIYMFMFYAVVIGGMIALSYALPWSKWIKR